MGHLIWQFTQVAELLLMEELRIWRYLKEKSLMKSFSSMSRLRNPGENGSFSEFLGFSVTRRMSRMIPQNCENLGSHPQNTGQLTGMSKCMLKSGWMLVELWSVFVEIRSKAGWTVGNVCWKHVECWLNCGQCMLKSGQKLVELWSVYVENR